MIDFRHILCKCSFVLLSLLAMTGPGVPASAQVSSVDYVITRTQLDAAGTKYIDAVQYYDGAASQAEYSYDAAGRMTSDANKGITSITYNAIGSY